MALVGGFLLGYLLGSIPFAWLVGRRRGIDLREVGSGNVGVGNLGELVGWWWGFAVFLLDVAKAVSAVLLAGVWGDAPQVAAGWGVIVGHSWPVWLGFIGGRGQLVTLAAGMVVSPWATLVVLPVLGAGMLWRPSDSRPGRRSRLAPAWLLAILSYPLLAAALDGSYGAVYASGAAVLTVIRRLTGSIGLTRRPLRESWKTRLVHDREP